MPDSNNKRQKRKRAAPAAKLQREIEKGCRADQEVLDILAEIISWPDYAAMLTERSAKSGNPVGVEVALLLAESLYDEGTELSQPIRAHIMEHARMTPEQRKKLLSPFDLN